MLAKSKLNSIESLVSRALIDIEISHEEFTTILKEKDIWGDEKKRQKYKREIRRKKPRKYAIKQCEFKKNKFVSM